MVDATVGSPPPGWSPGSVPVVVVGVVDGGADDVAAVDATPYDTVLAADDPMLAALLDQVGCTPWRPPRSPCCCGRSEQRAVEEGLAAESAVDSTLQAGAEFAAAARAWRGGLPPTRNHRSSSTGPATSCT